MRITLDVCNIGYTEQGISLLDKEGNHYHWITKTKISPLIYSSRNEWFKISANLCETMNGKRILKNVRVVK